MYKDQNCLYFAIPKKVTPNTTKCEKNNPLTSLGAATFSLVHINHLRQLMFTAKRGLMVWVTKARPGQAVVRSTPF